MRALLRPLARQGPFLPASLPDGRRRLLLLQLDGVSRARLSSALAAGLMPQLARRLEEGRLVPSRSPSGIPPLADAAAAREARRP